MNKKKTTEEFIEEARKVHGDKYDYSKAEYNGNKTKLCIICPEHGEFWQKPVDHLAGKKCKKCSKVYMDTDFFIEKSRKVHGDKYDYSRTEYIKDKIKVCILCPEHGEFWQDPSSHLNGCGCPACGGSKKLTTEEFVEKSKKIHGNKYDYSESIYVNRTTLLKIICPEHGEFFQKPSEHLSGCGCPSCGIIKRGMDRRKDFDEFVEQAKLVHRSKYLYDETTFSTMKNKTRIICPEHGEFWQEPDSHINGCGCPKCSVHKSQKENELFEFIKASTNFSVIQRVRDIIPPYEIDIYIPELKIGIEYNGIVWHSEKFGTDKKYHLNKLNLCINNGIRLIQVFEDEYLNNEELVKCKLLHIIGINKLDKKIYGRNVNVAQISSNIAEKFLSENHIQGFSRSSIYLGAYDNDLLCGVMTFKHFGNDSWELNRFATHNKYLCPGVGGKLFKYFIDEYNPKIVKSFSDRRWGVNENSNLYLKLGFKFDGYTPPDYKYFSSKTGYKRVHKFNFRKQTLHKKYGLPLTMTESEMTKELGYYRIWDCGLIRYVWKKTTAS